MCPTVDIAQSGHHCPSCDGWLPRGIGSCARCGAPLSDGGFRPFGGELSARVRSALQARYAIVAEIGRGSHAVVYLAIQKSLERKVALKVLRPHLAGNERFVRRFHTEARSIAQLRHPSIVAIYDEGTEQGMHFMAMEYLEGQNLHRLINSRGHLSPRETVHVAAQIARALDYAHARGLIHRDVKSGNIIVTSDWRAVLMDFGIAHPKSMPHGGSIIGTPEFMSPEQAAGKPVDARTDFYGLGAVMYHALSGHTPYESGDGLTTLRRIGKDDYQRLREQITVPAWLEQAVDRCLEKDRERRIGRGEELLSMFEANGMGMAGLITLSHDPQSLPAASEPAALKRSEPAAKPALSAVPERRGRALRAVGWALAGGLIVGIVGVGYLGMMEERPQPVRVVDPVSVVDPEHERATSSADDRVAPAVPDSVATPMLVGLTPDAARDSLALYGLAVGPTLRAITEAGFAGRVFKQIPAPGMRVKRGRKVVLHVGLDGQNP